ncbi:uroporphyrinogen decarboxylase family protein [Novipirellula artificiosorum]|uniref:Methylcobalamin:coenzyme M methyltransferase n=1 Tax=Novipirellula artificiosorum TaxID=2528016 RepID=A0A5C6E0R6_9BACT|nr:uroporphyrinogen decarboxylase family protein [Novipirellula artificiosorum]TWU40936.1 methylcobalamin:coenzyme M methyltransferase [Novipirellula artificiosorum]
MMNSRQRVLSAIRHQEPDQVPVDLGSTPSSGISAIAYNALVGHLDLDVGPAKVYDVVQQLAQPDPQVLDHFGVDVLDIGRVFNTAPSDWYPYTLADGSTAHYPTWFRPERQEDGSWIAKSKDGMPIAKMPEGGTFFDQTFFPFPDQYPDDLSGLDDAMGKVLWAAFAHSPWDHLNDEGFWQTLRGRAIELRSTSDRALMIVVGCNLFEWGTFLRRMDNFLMDLVAEPDNVARLLDELIPRHLAFLEKVCHYLGDVADICRFGDDLGMDSGPFMRPETYRTLFKPRHKLLCDYVKQHSSMHTFLHCCGGIRPLIGDLIDAGFEVLNPVQTACADMDPTELKREFGREITFWGGGCDTRQVLNNATPEQVKSHVREQVEIFAPGGGFVFNTVHNILPEVPPQNVIAMFEALGEIRGIAPNMP